MSGRRSAEALRVAIRDRPDRDRIELAEMVRQGSPLTSSHDVTGVVDRALARAMGLGPLLSLLSDPEVTEIMINGSSGVWVDRAGHLSLTELSLSPTELEHLIERILEPLGLRVDRLNPIVDARLKDGSRVHVVIPPLALGGPLVTIRRFSSRRISLSEFGDREVTQLISRLVAERATILVVGETGSGKTTLISSIGSLLDPTERVVVIEDTAELKLPGDHIVRLEARPPNSEGIGMVSIRDLVKASLRMRPDRIVIGEVRGGEALDLLLALTSGHQGSFATCHAGSAEAGLHRLATLAILSSAKVPLAAIERLVSAAIDVVIVVRRTGPLRRIVSVSEAGELLSVNELWPEPQAAPTRRCVVRSIGDLRIMSEEGRRRV